MNVWLNLRRCHQVPGQLKIKILNRLGIVNFSRKTKFNRKTKTIMLELKGKKISGIQRKNSKEGGSHFNPFYFHLIYIVERNIFTHKIFKNSWSNMVLRKPIINI